MSDFHGNLVSFVSANPETVGGVGLEGDTNYFWSLYQLEVRMLREYPYLLEEAERLRRRADRLEDDLWSVSVTASLSGMPFGGSVSDSTARRALDGEAEKDLRTIQVLRQRADELENAHLEISTRLRTLSPQERQVLCAREIGPFTTKWRALSHHLTPKRSIRWWQNLHKQALANMRK